jgi:antitoxin StbD
MSKKSTLGNTASIEEFLSDPIAVIAQANGNPVAVISSENDLQFYAVPAQQYEEMIDFIEFTQRGTTDLISTPSRFHLTTPMVERMTAVLKNLRSDYEGEFIEDCQNR